MSIQGLAIFSAKGHGTNSAYCSGVNQSPDISGSQSESKFGSTFYPHHVIESRFTVTVTFPSEDKRNKFSAWMYDYGNKLASGTANSMQITVPAINFMAFGVPTGGFEVERMVGSTVQKVDITFERMDGLVKVTKPPMIPMDAVVAKFYPTGQQLGSTSKEEDLYDVDARTITEGLTTSFESKEVEVAPPIPSDSDSQDPLETWGPGTASSRSSGSPGD